MNSTSVMKIIVQFAWLIFGIVRTSLSQELLTAKFRDSTHHAVVAILRTDTSGNVLVAGSGVLIHPRVILTAGHVNYKESGKLPGKCNVIGHVSNSNLALNSYQHSFNWNNDVLIYPDAEKFDMSFSDTTGTLKPIMFIDIGLIFLDEPIRNVVCASLPKPQLLDGFQSGIVVGVGYGYHKLLHPDFEFSLVDGLRRNWQVKSFSLINDRWLAVPCDTVAKQQFMNICDSGSPMLLNDNTVIGTWAMAGVYPYPGMAVRTDNPQVLKWIRKQVKNRLNVKI